MKRTRKDQKDFPVLDSRTSGLHVYSCRVEAYCLLRSSLLTRALNFFGPQTKFAPTRKWAYYTIGGIFEFQIWGACIRRGLYRERLIFGILRYLLFPPESSFRECSDNLVGISFHSFARILENDFFLISVFDS